MAVARWPMRQHLRRDVLGQAVAKLRAVGVQHLGDAGDLRRGLRRRRPALWPATSTCTSPPHCSAAVTVLSVASLIVALSCSAMTR